MLYLALIAKKAKKNPILFRSYKAAINTALRCKREFRRKKYFDGPQYFDFCRQPRDRKPKDAIKATKCLIPLFALDILFIFYIANKAAISCRLKRHENLQNLMASN